MILVQRMKPEKNQDQLRAMVSLEFVFLCFRCCWIHSVCDSGTLPLFMSRRICDSGNRKSSWACQDRPEPGRLWTTIQDSISNFAIGLNASKVV